MRLTGPQERAVRAPGSVAVTAGAGCGKTSLLAERYVHHLAQNGLSPLEIVAVTFTEKAAEELRSRVRRRVVESLSAETVDVDETAAELEAAQISTIHALCARVCREHPAEAGVPPDFAILDEVSGGVWMADRLLDALDGLPRAQHEALPYELLKDVLDAMLADPVSAAYALERAEKDGLDGWEVIANRERRQAIAALLEDGEVKRCAATLSNCSGKEGDLAEVQRATAVAALKELSDPEIGGDTDRADAALEALSSINLRGGKKDNWNVDDLAVVKDALGRLRAQVREEIDRGLVNLQVGSVDERLAGVLPVLSEAFDRVSKSLAEAKKRARVLDFADLEVYARRALQHEEVQSYYRDRWRAVLVDEVQDTNPVQAEILQKLTADTKFTIVGDEKQSIYGFRRADVEVFRRFKEVIQQEPGGSEEVLSTTFRCHGPLTNTLNATFSPILDELHQNLIASRAEPPHPSPHVRLFAIEAADKVRKAARERAEAAHIADAVLGMVEKGVLIYDGDRERPAEPGDFAVLSRTWSPLDGCGEALSAVGIPSIHAGGGDLLETREAKDGEVLLRFLSDPEDDLALVALLRSPFFAVEDPTLHEISLNRQDGESWWEAVRSANGASDSLSTAREVLEGLLNRVETETPTALLASADRATGYTAVIANLPGSERRKADWRGFVELVRGLEIGHGSVFSVVRSLGRMHGAGVAVPRPVVEAAGAVSLMTIHSAKGLEWPVVIVPDLSRGPRSDSPAVLFDPDLGVGLKFGEDLVPDGDLPVVYSVIEDRRARQREAEDKRLFYVALTRARDHLILTTTDLDTQKACGMTLLRPGLEAAGVEAASVPFVIAATR